MAEAGYYEVSTRDKWHEVKRSNNFRNCQGVGHDLTEMAYVYLHSKDCEGIPVATLYVSLPDPRDRHMISVCVPCAVEFKASDLIGNVQKYIPVSEEKLRSMKAELQEVLAGLKAP